MGGMGFIQSNHSVIMYNNTMISFNMLEAGRINGVKSMKEYEEKAVSLALNRSKLQDLTHRLKASRLTCPLFDTTRWVKNLERAYFKMWNLYCSGQHPQL